MRRRVAIKYCRHCGRIIPLDSTDCPYCGRLIIRAHEQKECPFCREPIKAKAIKCKHCGEFLDGRPAHPPDRQQILHIEKAVIAARKPDGQFELFRPDGRALPGPELPEGTKRELAEGAQGRLPEGQESPKALPAPAEPPAKAGKLPIAARASRTALRTALSVARTAGKGAVALARRRPSAATRKAVASPGAARAMPPVELECPICHRTVFEGDRYCENCGRDLSLRRGKRTVRPIARPYGPAGLALILGGAAPLGFLLPFPGSLLPASAGIALALWCAWRILRSEGRLTGLKPATGGFLLGVVWLVVIILAQVT